MAKFQFDKKQVGPAAIMGIVSAGLFVYFVLKMTTPPPIQAAVASGTDTTGTQVASAAPRPATTGAPGTSGPGSLVDGTISADPLMGEPTDTMRDPFVPAIVDTSNLPGKRVQMASSNLDFGKGSGLPNPLPPVGGVGPMPIGQGSRLPSIADAGPQWTVTGVLADSGEPRNRVAILRSGDTRRFVRLGDMVDGNFRLIDVSRTGVVLANGSHHIRLPLGGFKKVEGKHAPTLSGADTGPWQGAQSADSPSQQGAGPATVVQPGQPQPSQSLPGTSLPVPGQSLPAVPDPQQTAPTPGMN